MSIFTTKCILTVLIILVTVYAGRLALQTARRYTTLWHISDAFADGIFFGIALFHLLPHAYFHLRGLHLHLHPIWIMLILLGFLSAGFLILTGIDRFKSRHSAWVLLTMLSIHAFVMGSVMGIGQHYSELLLIGIGILLHKGFESFALITGLRRYWKKDTELKLALTAFTFVTPLGIFLGGAIQYHLVLIHHAEWLQYLNAFAAGTFIYIASTHSKDHNHSHDALKHYQQFLVTAAGVALMALLAFWV